MKPDVSSRSPAFRYGVALAAALAALALRWALTPFIGSSLPYVTLFPAVMIVAVAVGTGPALMAAVLGMVLSDRLFTETTSHTSLSLSFSLTVRRIFLLLTTLGVAWVGYTLRAARSTAEAAARASADRERTQEAWARLALQLSAARTPAEGAEVITSTALEFWKWDAALILLYNPRTDTVKELVNFDTIDGKRTKISVPDPGLQPSPLVRRVMQQGGQVIQRQEAGADDLTVRFGDTARTSLSLMFVPIRHQNENIGVFSVQSYRPGAFCEADLQRLQELADQCANALVRMEAEEKLRENEALLRTVTSEAHVGLVMLNVERRFVFANSAYGEMFGLPTDDLVGRLAADVLPRFYSHIQPHLDRALAGERLLYEISVENDRSYSVSYEPRKNEAGAAFVVMIVLDITQRIQAEKELRQSEARFRQLADAMPQVVWTANSDGQVDYYNERVSTFSGAVQRADGIWEWKALLHPDDLAPTTAAWQAATQEKGLFAMEHRIRVADGSYRWHLSRAMPVQADSGEVLKWFGTATDIHEQKLAEEKLEQMVAERTATLREMIADLEHFSYTITHDMRAPLRAIKGFSEIVIEMCADFPRQEPKGLLRRIHTAAGRMDCLITDALRFGKALRTELILAPVDVTLLLRGIIESYPNFDPSRVHIEIQDGIPCVIGNEAGLTQCFSNLLENAVKFVAAGQVPRIRIWGEQRDTLVRIWCEDNGIGIPEAAQVRVFDLFHRLSGDYEGTGIGLALVRKVIEQMGGKVGVESKPGQGSRFWLELKPATESKT